MQLPFGTFSQLQYLFETNLVYYIPIWYDLAPTDFSKVFEQYQAHLEYQLGQEVPGTSKYLQVLFQHIAFFVVTLVTFIKLILSTRGRRYFLVLMVTCKYFSGTFSIQILSFLSQFGTFFQLSPADFG